MRDKVKAGALLLDRAHPGWHNQVDITALEMNNCSWCVLGQLFGRYGRGLMELIAGWDFETGAEFGFDVMGDDASGTTYDELHELWIAEIAQRREGRER